MQYTSTQCVMLHSSNKYSDSIDGDVEEDGLFNGDYSETSNSGPSRNRYFDQNAGVLLA